MPVKVRITLLFSLLVLGILTLVCASVYYFSYTNRIQDVQLRLKNRAITTGRLLSQSGVFDQKLIRRIDEATSLAMKDKVVEAYDRTGKMIYRYCDNPSDSILVDSETLVRARERGNIYFVRGNKDAVAYYYKDTDLVIVTGAYDEPGSEKLRHLRMVLSLSFIGGLLSAIVVGSFFAVSLLRPLRRIADEVNDISARDLTRRIRSTGGGPGDEWGYLSDTLNSLLNRLQESFEIQGRFIANASHELSTPLTSISSQLEVSLQRVRSMEDYRRVIQSVYQDVQQMNKLTQTLLEFAKASGTAGGLEIDQVRIDEILLRLPGEISKTAEGYSVMLDFDRLPEEEERLLVWGNEELLFMAVKNMVTNACKYSDDHNAVIRLSVNGREIVITIEDKGRGIAEAEWENIFQPFYRTEEGHSIPGFGLGLSLARRIIKLHKGEIDVESIIGEGSRFIVRLPTGAARALNSNSFLIQD
jgi:signal transduction histidine kinase